MNNFGVVEVASTRTTNAPGWAYVPDTGINPALAALQPANRKRAAAVRSRASKLSLSDLSARQEAAFRKELDALDRDAFKDVAIPIPARPGGSRAAQTKHTPNVRKILVSQKTFANHLGDYEALQGSADTASGSATPRASQPHTPAASTPAPTGPSTSSRRQFTKKQQPTPKNKPPLPPPTDDVEMTDAPPLTPQAAANPPKPDNTILPPYTGRTPAAHPGDADPLLKSRVPPLPTDSDLIPLLLAPPLPYPALMARAAECDEQQYDEAPGGRQRYPVRVFCTVCGYWGRVKCIKCGTRVCALDCLEVHREECVTRYGH